MPCTPSGKTATRFSFPVEGEGAGVVRDDDGAAARRYVLDTLRLHAEVAPVQKLRDRAEALFVQGVEAEIVDLFGAVSQALPSPLLLEEGTLRDVFRRRRRFHLSRPGPLDRG
jgi:hypothetical protein